MNKISIFVLTFLLILTSCNKEKLDKNNVELSGTIKGLKKGKIYIQKVEEKVIMNLDTVVINGDSNFKTTFKLTSPEMLYLYLDRGVSNSQDNRLLFFAEPGKMTITTDLDFFLAKAKITGSKNQELYEQYHDIISKFNEQQLELLKEEILALKGKNAASDATVKKNDALLKRKYMYAANFALTNANYEIAPYVALTDIYDINIKFLDTIQKSMSPKVAKSKYGRKLNDFLQRDEKKNKL